MTYIEPAISDLLKADREARSTITLGKCIIELSVNGDPYGRGFTGSESQDSGNSWFYRGDVGAQSRAWWRRYARRNGYILREVR